MNTTQKNLLLKQPTEEEKKADNNSVKLPPIKQQKHESFQIIDPLEDEDRALKKGDLNSSNKNNNDSSIKQ